MLNDLNALKAVCAETCEVKLCLDCISSIATIPVNLERCVILWPLCAIGGKGLRSFPGLGMVFYNHDLKRAAGKLPRYLDLELYARHQGVAFTQSSNLIHALYAAVKKNEWPQRFAELREISEWLRPKLREMGFDLLIADEQASPAVNSRQRCRLG